MAETTVQEQRWVRAEDGIIGGVCLGMARQFQVDPLMVRVGWLIAVLFFGTGVWAYVLCILALPRTDKLDQAYDKKILGVCARVARRGNIEVGLVRLLALILLLSTAGLCLVAYFVLHFVLPEGGTASNGSSRSII